MLRVAVLELPARWGDAAGAVCEMDGLLALGPTDLVIVPELAFAGYVSPRGSFDVRRFAEPIDGPTIRATAEVARARGVHIVAPLVLREGHAMFNAAVLVDPDGAVRATYRKRRPWFPETWATAGTLPSPVVTIGGIRVAFAICYDAHFLPLDAADVLPRVDLLAFTSAWVDEEHTRVPLLQELAGAYGVTIANANWGPGAVLVEGQGGSCVIDASRTVVSAVVTGGSRRADAIVSPRRGSSLGVG